MRACKGFKQQRSRASHQAGTECDAKAEGQGAAKAAQRCHGTNGQHIRPWCRQDGEIAKGEFQQ